MIVFDAGALIALDNGDRRMWAEWEVLRVKRARMFVPDGVLAQAWRGGPQARLSRVMKVTYRASFDEIAKDAGELCGRAGTSDVIDSSVALVASRPGVRALYTSDPDDLGALLRAAGCRRGHPKIVRC